MRTTLRQNREIEDLQDKEDIQVVGSNRWRRGEIGSSRCDGCRYGVVEDPRKSGAMATLTLIDNAHRARGDLGAGHRDLYPGDSWIGDGTGRCDDSVHVPEDGRTFQSKVCSVLLPRASG